jgi:hypothetical protein
MKVIFSKSHNFDQRNQMVRSTGFRNPPKLLLTKQTFDVLQTCFYDFLKIQVTNYGSFEEMKKGTSAIHGATVFFIKRDMAPRHSIFL